MCQKCEKALATPSILAKPESVDVFMQLVDAVGEPVMNMVERLIDAGVKAGKPIHPCNIGLLLGWFYHTIVLNGIADGYMSKEEFAVFDSHMKKMTEEGVAIARSKQSKVTVKAIDFDDLPVEIKELLSSLKGSAIH